MGLSLMSALMIQGNEIRVDTYSNTEKTDYGFIVYLMKDGEIHTNIVDTTPHFPYESKEEAKEMGDLLVEEVRKIDLSSRTSKIEKIIGPENSKIVSGIVSETKNL